MQTTTTTKTTSVNNRVAQGANSSATRDKSQDGQKQPGHGKTKLIKKKIIKGKKGSIKPDSNLEKSS